MAIRLRLPDIKGTDREQLRQIRSYLYGLIPQLQWALDREQQAQSTPANVPEEVFLPAAALQRTAENTAAWTELGLSGEVGTPATVFGRGGMGCRFLKREGRVSVAFCCAVSETPAHVNANPLPADCRPSAPVRAVCAAEFSDGSHGTACVQITPDGNAEILAAFSPEGDTAVTAIDGAVDFFCA